MRSVQLYAALASSFLLAACGDPQPSAGVGGANTGGVGGANAGAAGVGGAQATAGLAGTATLGGAGSGGMAGSAGLGGGGVGGGNAMPVLLSETGLYSDIKNKTLAADVKPFVPAYTLWSDSADKHRFVYMPPGKTINTENMEFWQYPAGFKLWKDFSRDGKLIETRLLMKLSDGLTDWYMVAFKWRDDYSEADAVPDGEMNAMGTQHDIPSKEDCLGCHSSMADHAIGFSALMLSHSQPNSVTLAELIQQGWFSKPPAAPFALPGGDAEKAALGYLHANCGMCHNTKSQVYKAKVSLDLWSHLDQLQSVQQTRAYLSMVCDQWPGDKFSPITACEANHATGAKMETDISKPKRVMPKEPANSGVHDLMSLRATGMVGEMKQMPPIGTEMVDTTGLAAVDAWINSLPTQ